MELKGKKIILGVTGGIAAYKACELARRLDDEGAMVHAVLTEAALAFITPLTFQAITRNPVHTRLFDLNEESKMSHIELATLADLVIIAPTTANMIAKLAHGIADDLLSTMILATEAPVFFAPAMNVNMWKKKVVQDNIQKLLSNSYHMIEPEEGHLACGVKGKGRMAEVSIILEALHTFKCKKRP